MIMCLWRNRQLERCVNFPILDSYQQPPPIPPIPVHSTPGEFIDKNTQLIDSNKAFDPVERTLDVDVLFYKEVAWYRFDEKML